MVAVSVCVVVGTEVVYAVDEKPGNAEDCGRTSG